MFRDKKTLVIVMTVTIVLIAIAGICVYHFILTDDEPVRESAICVLTYDSNNNSGITESLEVTIHSDVTNKIRENTFTNEGFVFVTWNTEADGTGIAYMEKSNIFPEEDTTLYAIWGTMGMTDIDLYDDLPSEYVGEYNYVLTEISSYCPSYNAGVYIPRENEVYVFVTVILKNINYDEALPIGSNYSYFVIETNGLQYRCTFYSDLLLSVGYSYTYTMICSIPENHSDAILLYETPSNDFELRYNPLLVSSDNEGISATYPTVLDPVGEYNYSLTVSDTYDTQTATSGKIYVIATVTLKNINYQDGISSKSQNFKIQVDGIWYPAYYEEYSVATILPEHSFSFTIRFLIPDSYHEIILVWYNSYDSPSAVRYNPNL